MFSASVRPKGSSPYVKNVSLGYTPGQLNQVHNFTLNLYIYCHMREWLQTEFRFGTGFIDHFTTLLVTTSNYSAIADLHT
jgi:hypothetical protein